MPGTLADLTAQAARMAENQRKALEASKAVAASIAPPRPAQAQPEAPPQT